MEQFNDIRIEDQQNDDLDKAIKSQNKIGLNIKYLPTLILYFLITVILFILYLIIFL